MLMRLALIGQTCLLADAAVAETSVYVTAQGVAVGMPAVESLGCADLRGVLRAIDRSHYRVGRSLPLAPADAALHAYENRVSMRYYRDCVVAPGATADAASAFIDGFDGPEAIPE